MRCELLVAAALLAPPAAAAPTVAEVMQGLHKLVKLHDVILSPDGSRVGWVEQVATPDGPASDRSSIQVALRAQPDKPLRLTASPDGSAHDEDQPTFSPDGQRVAFLSDAEKKGQPQLYVADLAAGGKARKLTSVSGHLDRPLFSPDGKSLAVLFIEGQADALGPLGPATRQTGVVEEQVVEQRLMVLAADGSAAPRPVSPPPLFVYEYRWRPDGKAFVAVAAPGSGDDNWWVAQLHVFDLAGGDQVVYRPAYQIAEPVYSPDGTRIAFIEGLMSDQGSNGGDVYVVPAGGGAAKNLTPGMRPSASSLEWLKPDEIRFGAQVEGDAAFAAVPPGGGAVKILWRAPETVHKGSVVAAAFSRDGAVAAAVSERFDRPPEVVAGPLGSWEPITRRNAGLTSPAGAAQSIAWKSDRFDVQGWLVAPPQPPPAGTRAPMVVVVHGGPAGAVRSSWNEKAMILASQGYYVFFPNPRGSFGQGEAFTRGNVKDFGHGDLRDILAGVDAVLKRAPVDGERVGIYGHSYGGYMAMWAVTQTRRFRASVTSAGIANWLSYYGQNRIDQWMIPYFGKNVYEDPAVYARSSPMNFIDKVRTPTLVLHGERDAECPLPQGQEFWHGLKTLGVDTQLVIYADEGHHFRDPAHERDHDERMVGWFDRFLKPKSPLPAR